MCSSGVDASTVIGQGRAGQDLANFLLEDFISAFTIYVVHSWAGRWRKLIKVDADSVGSVGRVVFFFFFFFFFFFRRWGIRVRGR